MSVTGGGGIDLSTIDDEIDLDFDLDEKLVQAELNATNNTTKRKSVQDDQFAFKIPDVPKIVGNRAADNTLGQLFSNNDDDDEQEDEEDFLIRTQSFMPTSTQNAQCDGGVGLAAAIVDCNLTIIGTQAPSDLLDKNRSDINNNDGEKTADHASINKTTSPHRPMSLSDSRAKTFDKSVWSFAINDLKNSGLKDSIKEFNINYYNNKIFGNEFFKVSILRLPLLLASIKEISIKDLDTRVMLTDETDDYLLGVISKKIVKDHLDKLSPGSVLLLQDIVIMRVNSRKNCRSSINLIISGPTLIKIYYKVAKTKEESGSGGDGDQNVYEFSFGRINIEKIRVSINDFKTKLLKDPTSIEKAAERPPVGGGSGSSSSTSVNKIYNGGSSSNSSYKRPTPYPPPPPPSRSTLNNNNKAGSSSMPRSHSSSNQQPLQPTSVNQQKNINNSNFKQQQQQPLQKQQQSSHSVNSSKQFQFKTASAVSLSTSSTVPASQNEELLSQLIFGIEDEFLNDADD